MASDRALTFLSACLVAKFVFTAPKILTMDFDLLLRKFLTYSISPELFKDRAFIFVYRFLMTRPWNLDSKVMLLIWYWGIPKFRYILPLLALQGNKD